MAKPVTGLTTFGSNTSGTTTQLDNNFLACTNSLNDLNTYSNFLTDTGSANSIVVALGANLTGALTNGLQIQVKVVATNTGASTLNYNAGGALNVLNTDGTAVTASQMVAAGIYIFQYRAADTVWLLLNPSVSATAGLVLLSSVQANANAAISFNALITSAYDQYEIRLDALKPAGNDAYLAIQVGNGNANAGGYFAANYAWSNIITNQGASIIAQGSTANAVSTAAPITVLASGAPYNGANGGVSGVIKISASSGNTPAILTWQTSYIASFGFLLESVCGSGMMNGNQTITSVQLIPANANIVSGNVALYGIKRT